MRDPRAIEGTFFVQREDTRPQLIIEVVSPSYIKADQIEKVRIYAQARVREYVILDPSRVTAQPVIGYRLVKSAYRSLPIDEDGLVECATVGLLVGLAEDWVVVIESESGVRLQTYEEIAAQAEAAQARIAALEAGIKRLRGES